MIYQGTASSKGTCTLDGAGRQCVGRMVRLMTAYIMIADSMLRLMRVYCVIV